MLKIGLTGGIGTGKSTVASIFHSLKIPVLDADTLSKRLINTHQNLRQQLIDSFGPQTFSDNGEYNTAFISNIVFNDQSKLNDLNSIVHPYVQEYTQDWWRKMETHPYAIKEAAILIEANSHTDLDYIIGVDAPIDIRISRTMKRDQLSQEQVEKRMSRQMDNSEKMSHCDFVIINDDRLSLIEQVLELHEKLIQINKI